MKWGIGEDGIGQTIITDTTNFALVDFENLILIASNFIKR